MSTSSITVRLIPLAAALVVLGEASTSPSAHAALAAGATVRSFDLATGFVDGRRILGRNIAGVTAALGPPDYRRSAGRRYILGYRAHPPFFVQMHFRRVGGRFSAEAIVLQDVTLVETRIGRILRLSPGQIQARIAGAYGSQYKLIRPYRCRAGDLCSGEFETTGGAWHVTFGRVVSGARFLTIWLR
jgi:hypothetical protein